MITMYPLCNFCFEPKKTGKTSMVWSVGTLSAVQPKLRTSHLRTANGSTMNQGKRTGDCFAYIDRVGPLDSV